VLGVLKATRTVEVHFVDFGNREVVECEELRDMPAVILNELPVQAVACSLYGVEWAGGAVSVWSPGDVNMFSNMVCDQLLEVYFTASQNADGHYLVHLLKDQQNVNREFLRLTGKLSRGYASPVVDAMGAADAAAARLPPAVIRDAMDISPIQIAFKHEACVRGEQVSCVAAYVVSPAEFYLHKNSNVDALDAMMEQLNIEFEHVGLSLQMSVGIGQPCCALYDQDNRWYRAKLASMFDEKHVSVEFVDYGNTDTVSTGSVRHLPSQYFTLPVQAVRCQLADVLPLTGSDWSDDAAAFFEEQLLDSAHDVRVVSVDERIHTVEMKSIAQKLLDRGFAKLKGATKLAGRQTSRPVETSRVSSQQETWQLEMRKPSSRDFERAPKSPGMMSGGGSRSGFGPEKESWSGTTLSSYPEPRNFSPMNITTNTVHSVVVSWVVSPSEFYCQLIENCSVIEKLSSALCKTYQSARDNAMSSNECTVGRSCVAFYNADKSWYRGHIVSKASEKVTVFYVDYGNTEVVPVGHVRHPAAQFVTSPPVQAIKCSLRVATNKPASAWTQSEIAAFDKAVSVPNLKCKFLDKCDDGYVVELFDQSGRDVTSQLSSKSTSSAIVSEKEAKAAAVKMYSYECGLKKNDVVKLEAVYVADGSTVFSCHIVGQTDDLDAMMAELAEDCQHRPVLTSFPDIGQPCAALYSEDNGWYRATIDSIPADSTSRRVVKFVDYGNIESCDVSSLRELDSRFLCVPVRRVDCRLHGMTAASLNEVADDLLVLPFTATVVSVDNSNVVTVDLKSFASTHKELFVVQPKVSLPVAQPPPDNVDVYITHVVSPSDFYIQMTTIESDLTQLVEQLSEQYNSGNTEVLKLGELAVGDVCCAPYSADEAWYRAVVEDVSDDTVSVRFIDYGNTDVVSQAEIRRLRDRFVSLPACAYHCRLAVDSTISWTDEQQQQFVELTEAGEKLFACSFVSRSQPPYCVTLKDDAVDVGQQLCGSLQTAHVVATNVDHVAATLTDIPIAEPPSEMTEVCITSAESPSDFYIQLTSVEDELAQMADELIGEYDSMSADDQRLTNINVGSLCCARYSADGAWYRAVVTDMVSSRQVRVLFVDYGNSDVVTTSTDLKLLSPKFCSKPPFVYHCSLAGVSQAEGWSDEMKTTFLELTTKGEEQEPSVFSCQFVSRNDSTGYHFVSLQTSDGVSVSDMFADAAVEAGNVVYQPVVITPGIHKVSNGVIFFSLSAHCLHRVSEKLDPYDFLA